MTCQSNNLWYWAWIHITIPNTDHSNWSRHRSNTSNKPKQNTNKKPPYIKTGKGKPNNTLPPHTYPYLLPRHQLTVQKQIILEKATQICFRVTLEKPTEDCIRIKTKTHILNITNRAEGNILLILKNNPEDLINQDSHSQSRFPYSFEILILTVNRSDW